MRPSVVLSTPRSLLPLQKAIARWGGRLVPVWQQRPLQFEGRAHSRLRSSGPQSIGPQCETHPHNPSRYWSSHPQGKQTKAACQWSNGCKRAPPKLPFCPAERASSGSKQPLTHSLSCGGSSGQARPPDATVVLGPPYGIVPTKYVGGDPPQHSGHTALSFFGLPVIQRGKISCVCAGWASQGSRCPLCSLQTVLFGNSLWPTPELQLLRQAQPPTTADAPSPG